MKAINVNKLVDTGKLNDNFYIFKDVCLFFGLLTGLHYLTIKWVVT